MHLRPDDSPPFRPTGSFLRDGRTLPTRGRGSQQPLRTEDRALFPAESAEKSVVVPAGPGRRAGWPRRGRRAGAGCPRVSLPLPTTVPKASGSWSANSVTCAVAAWIPSSVALGRRRERRTPTAPSSRKRPRPLTAAPGPDQATRFQPRRALARTRRGYGGHPRCKANRRAHTMSGCPDRPRVPRQQSPAGPPDGSHRLITARHLTQRRAATPF